MPPSPKSFSNTACGLFSIGSGTVGRAPGNRVEVGAAVAGAAAQADFFDAELDRRQRRVLADVLGGQLIHGHADADGIFLRRAAAQEDRRRARVLRAGVGAGGAGVHEIADHRTCDRDTSRAELRRLRELEARALPSPASTCPSSPRAGRRCSRAASWERRRCSSAASARRPSIPGRATPCVTPAPRRNVRRDRCFFVMNISELLKLQLSAAASRPLKLSRALHAGSYVVLASSSSETDRSSRSPSPATKIDSRCARPRG